MCVTPTLELHWPRGYFLTCLLLLQSWQDTLLSRDFLLFHWGHLNLSGLIVFQFGYCLGQGICYSPILCKKNVTKPLLFREECCLEAPSHGLISIIILLLLLLYNLMPGNSTYPGQPLNQEVVWVYQRSDKQTCSAI